MVILQRAVGVVETPGQTEKETSLSKTSQKNRFWVLGSRYRAKITKNKVLGLHEAHCCRHMSPETAKPCSDILLGP
jgi:hypothetical protein